MQKGADMRKPRAIIYDDDISILGMLKNYISLRGYEVISFSEPVICPVYERHEDCTEVCPCADVIITDFKMPKMSGIELLRQQFRRGCKIDIRNKAVISGYMDDDVKQKIKELGCSSFQKPFKLSELSGWLDECEKRFDLSQPLSGIEKRRHIRHPYHNRIEYYCYHHDISEVSKSINLSESGICLSLLQEHSQGQNITINSGIPADSQKATIRWIDKLQDNSYIAGLMFV